MSLDIYNVHKVIHNKETNQMQLVGTNPYKRFVQEGETPINVQGGKFYYDEGGPPIPAQDVPSWVAGQLKLLSSDALSRLGFGPAIEPEPEPEAKLPVDLGVSIDRDPITSTEEEPEVVAEQEQSAIESMDALTLIDILGTLDHDQPSHWNKSGKPDLNHLKELMGRYVSRREVDETSPDLVRNQ
jgi:hypothetical protein